MMELETQGYLILKEYYILYTCFSKVNEQTIYVMYTYLFVLDPFEMK